MRPQTIWTVIGPSGRMVHYSTDRDEAEALARLQGCSVEPASEWRWYSQAALQGRGERGWVHPADRDIAREWASRQRAIDAAERDGLPVPELSITGPPILAGQLVE